MITEDYVSFETAKLLKEKGFNEPVLKFYSHKGEVVELYCRPQNKSVTSDTYKCPTLQMTMKWLRVVHNLEIYPYHDNSSIYSSKPPYKWWYEIIKWPNTVAEYESGKDEEFDTYEQTCEAAVKYCLENLIKNEDGEKESDIPVPKTIEEAISMLEKTLSDEDREYLLKNGAVSVHHSLGRWIRNKWGLWTDSELKNELKKKGLEHPDDMSNYIIEEFIKYWNNKL